MNGRREHVSTSFLKLLLPVMLTISGHWRALSYPRPDNTCPESSDRSSVLRNVVQHLSLDSRPAAVICLLIITKASFWHLQYWGEVMARGMRIAGASMRWTRNLPAPGLGYLFNHATAGTGIGQNLCHKAIVPLWKPRSKMVVSWRSSCHRDNSPGRPVGVEILQFCMG